MHHVVNRIVTITKQYGLNALMMSNSIVRVQYYHMDCGMMYYAVPVEIHDKNKAMKVLLFVKINFSKDLSGEDLEKYIQVPSHNLDKFIETIKDNYSFIRVYEWGE